MERTSKNIKEEINTAAKYGVTIIETKPFTYKKIEYLIDKKNIIHTYGNVSKGINSIPVGRLREN